LAHQSTRGNRLQLGLAICAMFIGTFQGMYECPSTTETLETIKQEYDENLQNYMKHLCNARNAIMNIQDIEIINAF
jgi:hypothetical protein